MRYSDFKKLAAGNTSQVRPGSTSMNFPSPMGSKKEAPMKKLPIAQDEVRVGYNDPAALRVAQAQTPILAQTMPGQQQPKPGFQFDYNKDLHNARQNAANEIQQMRRDTANGKQVDTSGLTPTQYRYVASGRKGSGYNIADTDEELQKTIYSPDPEDTGWRQKQHQDVIEDLRNRQANGEILTEKQLAGFTPEEKAYIGETRQQGIDRFQQAYNMKNLTGGRYREVTQKELDTMTPEERQQIFGNRYAGGGFVASDAFGTPLQPGETYKDRAQAVIDSLKAHVGAQTNKLNPANAFRSEETIFENWKTDNPEEFNAWFDSLVTATEGANMDALTFFQKAAQGGEGSAALGKLTEEQKGRLIEAGKKAVWPAIKKDPMKINQAIGLWLRQTGHGQMADFVDDPLYFYGSLAGIAAGSIFLGGIFGRDDDDEDRGYAVGGPRYNPQTPDGYNRIPYA